MGPVRPPYSRRIHTVPVARTDEDRITLRVGGQTRTELTRRLGEAGVLLNAHAETLLEHPAFDDPEPRVLQVELLTVADLGLPEGGTLPQVLAAGADLGLAPCPLETAPYLRLAMPDQAGAPDSVLSAGRAPTGAVHVVSAPVSEDVEHPKGFYLRVVDGQAWLRGFRCDDTYVWGPEQRVALVRR